MFNNAITEKDQPNNEHEDQNFIRNGAIAATAALIVTAPATAVTAAVAAAATAAATSTPAAEFSLGCR